MKMGVFKGALRVQTVTGQNGIGQNGTDKMVANVIDSNST